MDWELVIDRNTKALRRIVGALVAMAGLGGRPDGEGAGARPVPEKPVTLPRRLHRAVLRLLRPAESAARRLLVVVARDVTVSLPPRRWPRPLPLANPAVNLLRGLGIAVVVPAGMHLSRPRLVAAPRAHRFALADRPRRPVPPSPRGVAAHAAPRLSVPGRSQRRLLPPPPTPDDPLDATRLRSRLRALSSLLADLPGEALRLARWRARRVRAAARRLSPLRPGRPPGSLRRPRHEVHEVLADLHYFAREALPDTS